MRPGKSREGPLVRELRPRLSWQGQVLLLPCARPGVRREFGDVASSKLAVLDATHLAGRVSRLAREAELGARQAALDGQVGRLAGLLARADLERAPSGDEEAGPGRLGRVVE